MDDQEVLSEVIRTFGTQENFAQHMTKVTGEEVTNKRISNWHARGIPSNRRWDVACVARDRIGWTADDFDAFMAGGSE